MKSRRFRSFIEWFVLALLAVFAIGLSSYGVAQSAAMQSEQPVLVPLCSARQQADDKRISYDWDVLEPAPFTSYYRDPSLGDAYMVGGDRCGERYVEWEWRQGEAAPVFTWRDLSVPKVRQR